MIFFKLVDWDSWIAHIQHKIIMEGVWFQINPDIYLKLILRQELKQFFFDLVHLKPDFTQQVILFDDYKLEKK